MDVEFIGEIRRDTGGSRHSGAILVFDGANEIWVPNSLVLSREPVPGHDGNYTIVIPEWFAKKEGII
jgi:hypothetical protein